MSHEAASARASAGSRGRPSTGSVVVVGSASRDVAPDDPRGWRLGGAAAYVGLALARLGLGPRIVLGADPDAAAAAELDLLRDAGAEIRVAGLAHGPVFDNREVDGVRRQRCLEPGDPIATAAVPPEWRATPAWVFGPVAAELDPDWAALPSSDAFVALGWQGLLRTLPRGEAVRRNPPASSPLLSRADLVTVSVPDLAPGTAISALGSILRPGATLVVTDGRAGGTAWRVADGRARVVRRYAAIPAASEVDPTGAGDAFLAGLVAARLGHPLGGSGRRGTDLRLGAALGSLAVEAAGLHAIPDLAPVAARLRTALTPS